MAYSTDFDELLPDRVKIRSLASVSTDGYGVPVWALSTATYKARVTLKQQEVRSFDGVDEVATTVAWVATTSTFGPSSQLVRSTATGTPLGDVLAIEAPGDQDGRHHIKVMLG